MLCQGALEEMLSVCTTVLEKGNIVPWTMHAGQLSQSWHCHLMTRSVQGLPTLSFLLALFYSLLMPLSERAGGILSSLSLTEIVLHSAPACPAL